VPDLYREKLFVKIELLYFDGCPNHEAALKILREALSELEINEEVELIHVDDNEAAMKHRFLGSPSIRIGNTDLEDADSGSYSMQCRRYSDGSTILGHPSRTMIINKLKRHLDTSKVA